MVCSIKSLNEEIAFLYAKHVLEIGEQGYHLVKYNFVVSVLNFLYRSFVLDESITPIEDIPKEKKEEYWKIACMYHVNKEVRIKASQAIYTLHILLYNEKITDAII